MKNKIIRDSVHGYIEVPQDIINEIVDTAIFQRLRRIEQTSMNALYPSAHHDRFMHSLGVYHLGKLAMCGLIQNISSKPIYSDRKPFWDRYSISFELACLLHDCGHAPMSHSFEYGYLDWADEEDCLNKKGRLLQSMINGIPSDSVEIEKCQLDVDKYFEKPGKISPHEMVSAIIASEYYGDKIKKILLSYNSELTETELSECIVFIQRAILGLKYDTERQEEYEVEVCFKNCLIELLNGNFFDVDKLDYIVRDTIEAGTNNLSIDIPRILNALTLVEINHFDQETNVEDLELNNSIYFTTCKGRILDKSDDRFCECSINLSQVKIEGAFQGTLMFLGENNYVKTPSSKGKRGKGEESFGQLTAIEATFEDGCRMTGRFQGSIENMTSSTNEKVVDGLINAKISGVIKGTVIGNINIETERRSTYEIGYLKNAISVIEDTLIARNRLYLWIYAHNKVTYNDYLLRHGILLSLLNESHNELGMIEKVKQANLILRNKMDIDNIFCASNKSLDYLLDDGELINSLKISFIKNGEKNKFADEYLSRKHMYPVWKSYVEYNNFFSNLSSEERKKLWESLFGCEEIENNLTEANSQEYNKCLLTQFSDKLEYVWIKPHGFKLKELNVSNIYIVLSDNSVKRLKDVMTQEKVTEQYVDESFFYLYTTKKLDPAEKLQLVSFLKSKMNS